MRFLSPGLETPCFLRLTLEPPSSHHPSLDPPTSLSLNLGEETTGLAIPTNSGSYNLFLEMNKYLRIFKIKWLISDKKHKLLY